MFFNYPLILSFIIQVLFAYFSMASFIIPFVRKIAFSYKYVDDPKKTSRKIHKRPTPYLGGVSIYIGFLISITIYTVFFNRVSPKIEMPGWLLAYVVGGGLMLIVGTFDDIYDVSALKKLGAQIAIATLSYFGGIQFDHIALPGYGIIVFEQFSLPITVLVITAAMNAINIIDGMDGLASGVVLIAAIANMFLALYLDAYFVVILSAILVATLFAFLKFNWNPASIFLGDGGSHLIAYLVIIISIQNIEAAHNFTNILVPVFAFLYPIIDILFAMLRRVMRGKPVMSADKTHIHHFLMSKGFSYQACVLAILVFSSVMVSVAWLYIYDFSILANILLILIVLSLLLFFAITGYFRPSLLSSYLRHRPMLRIFNSYRNYVVVRIKYASSIDDIWKLMKEVADEYNLEYFKWVDSQQAAKVFGRIKVKENIEEAALPRAKGKILFEPHNDLDSEVCLEVESLIKNIANVMDKKILKLSRRSELKAGR